MDKLKAILPANRVAAIVGILLAVAAFITDLNTSLVPGSPGAEAIGKALIAIAAIVKVMRIVEKFLEGSQNFDSLLLSGQPKNSGLVNASATVDEGGEAELAQEDTLLSETQEMPAPDADDPELKALAEGTPEGSVSGKFGETA